MNFQSLKTIDEMAKPYSPFSSATLRWFVFNATSNGLADVGAIVRIGKRVYIDTSRFNKWIESHHKHSVD